MKTVATVSIDAELWKRAKQAAAELGISTSALVELALRLLLTCRQPQPEPPPAQQQAGLEQNAWVQALRSKTR